MTDPRAAAVEAAAKQHHERRNSRRNTENDVIHSWEHVVSEPFHAPYVAVLREDAEAAITAYLAHMAEAGWGMVRDVGEAGEHDTYDERWYEDGWNDCRAAMLGSKGDE